tara:strand:- start:222 stop:1043 length:822 start_codon:yes stop_codon:yes gene_type:complete
MSSPLVKCFLCGSLSIKVAEFSKKINKENIFGLDKKKYLRKLYRCKKCSHFFNHHNHEKFLFKMYKNNYANYSYNKIEKTFSNIYSLKKKESANYFRIKYFINYLNKLKIMKPKILDFGSGIGIFPFKLKELGYDIEFCEKDYLSFNFIKKKLNIKPFCRDIFEYKNLSNKKFNVITCNKVLEHFSNKNLIRILRIFKKLLLKNGIMYIELPDGESASNINYERQEFFFEHFNIFSKKSISILLNQNNFKIIKIQKIFEINKKYTLRIFAIKK